MELQIDPEPTPEEREAIVQALGAAEAPPASAAAPWGPELPADDLDDDA